MLTMTGQLWSDEHPFVPTSFSPLSRLISLKAWNNQNLQRLAEKIKSPLVFAHVRASTSGALSETNCHPWRYGRLMFMHNGQISGFSKIKRRIVQTLPEELFLLVLLSKCCCLRLRSLQVLGSNCISLPSSSLRSFQPGARFNWFRICFHGLLESSEGQKFYSSLRL